MNLMPGKKLLPLLLLAAMSAHAQLKPSTPPSTPVPAPAAPAAPSAPAAPTTDPITEAKQAAAAQVAGEWLKLIDSGDYAKAWEACSPLFREKVTQQAWVDGVPKNRAEYGKFKSRTLGGTAYRTALPGAPDGEYVTVRFVSDYEKNAAADELVTLTYQAGAWRPLGYLLR